eukprot:TRINITY_DN79655_c0_g1_i1.p1 TRINITY_DN79655_c0_g1~~TRINITY_DN79655_c0_g1_i1.p1  ORF type:complete len:102 (-),score=4.90 TRINITY_DN79655_c0_g1_i1:50-355(-)
MKKSMFVKYSADWIVKDHDHVHSQRRLDTLTSSRRRLERSYGEQQVSPCEVKVKDGCRLGPVAPQKQSVDVSSDLWVLCDHLVGATLRHQLTKVPQGQAAI